MTPSRRSAAWRRIALRCLGLGLVAAVLVTNLQLDDTLELVDGQRLEGRVEQLPDGTWRVEADGGAIREVPASQVASRQAGGDDVVAVTWGLRSIAARLTQKPLAVLEVLLLLFATYLITGWRWLLLCRAADVQLSPGEALRLNFIGAFFNTAVPGSTGGDVVKAWYAARVTGRGVRAVLAVFADRLTGLVGLALFAAGALLALGGREGLTSARLIVALAVAALLGGSLVLLSARLRRWLGLGKLARRLPFHAALAEASAALRLYRSRPVPLLLALCVSFINHAIAGVSVFLLARALGIGGVELPMALALVPIANLFGAIPLLPGGWGVGEVAFAYLFSRVGVSATEAISLSIVFRLSMLVVSLPGGVLWLFWRGRPSRAVIEQDVEGAEDRLEAREVVVEETEEARP